MYYYTHIYHCFKVNPRNEIEFVESKDIDKKTLDRKVLFKLPFYVQNHIYENDIKLESLKLVEKACKQSRYVETYIKPYEKLNLIEPNILFDVKNHVYKFVKSKSRLDLHTNLSFRNFYSVKEGVAIFILIHPSYKDLFMKNNKLQTGEKTIQFMKNNPNFIFIELHKNSILYVPNYWMVYMEPVTKETTDVIIEKIQYIPVVNKLNKWYNNVVNNQDLNE